MLRHSRTHHRTTQRIHRLRRLRLLQAIWNGLEPDSSWPPSGYDTHLKSDHLLGHKNRAQRRREERHFRQTVRRALMYHDEALPILKPDWAD